MTKKRLQDIESHIEQAQELLREYETLLRQSKDPGEKAQYRTRISDLKAEIKDHERDRRQSSRLGGSENADLDESDFENRNDELDKLDVERLRSIRSPYTLVSAPAGFGKTFLFRRLLSRIGDDETTRQKWSVCHVDFSQADENPIDYAIRCVGQLEEANLDTSVDSICEYLIQSLSEPLCLDCRRSIVLVLDAVERLKEPDRKWFFELLARLYERTHSGHSEIIAVRVIIAGHDVDHFWNGYQANCSTHQLAPQRIQLSPFERQPIEQMLWKRAQRPQVNLDDQTLAEIAAEVQYLSGGHPKIIHDLVDWVAKKGFAVAPVPEYFGQRRQYLVRLYVSRVASAFLDSVELQLAKSLETLSIFRRVNACTIQMLANAGELPSQTDEVRLLGDLVQGQWLDKPSLQEPFYRDYLIRRILAMSMAYGPRETELRYRHLNKLALDLYYDWICDQERPLPADFYMKPLQRLFSVVEWLFHALQDEEMSTEDLCKSARAHVRVLSAEGQPSSVLKLIEDGIKKDSELSYLLDRRLGDGGASRIIEFMRL